MGKMVIPVSGVGWCAFYAWRLPARSVSFIRHVHLYTAALCASEVARARHCYVHSGPALCTYLFRASCAHHAVHIISGIWCLGVQSVPVRHMCGSHVLSVCSGRIPLILLTQPSSVSPHCRATVPYPDTAHVRKPCSVCLGCKIPCLWCLYTENAPCHKAQVREAIYSIGVLGLQDLVDPSPMHSASVRPSYRASVYTPLGFLWRAVFAPSCLHGHCFGICERMCMLPFACCRVARVTMQVFD